MKKFLFRAAVVIVALAAASIIVVTVILKHKKAETAVPGAPAANFILGMQGETTHALNSFIQTNTVILSFTDSGYSSDKFEKMIPAALGGITTRKGVKWFNIKREQGHALIEEKGVPDGLRYKALADSIPKFYSFSGYPAVIILDKAGIIQFIYIGYSPTFINDLRSWFGKNRK